MARPPSSAWRRWNFDIKYEETTDAEPWECWNGHTLDDETLDALEEAQ